MIAACRKDEHITIDVNAKITLSKDSILFDTIFTSIGSATKRIKLINENNDAVNISEIKLSGGALSSFGININGQNTAVKNNLVLNGHDSLNIFVKVTINPNAKDLTFLVQDSIIISSNGNRQAVRLLAYGQNAVFINNGNINTSTTWTKNLPYIIYGSVNVKNGSTLSIQPGTKIYFHKDAAMNIEGTLDAYGTTTEPVQFYSDRLEAIFNDEPGQWQGIYFKQTGTGQIKYSIIKNASVGITSDSLSTNGNPKLILTNNVIKNMQVAAYIGYHSELIAFNNLMYNCGNYIIYAVGGGNYNLKQNTFAGFNPDLPRKTAGLTFSDYISAKVFNNLQLDLVNNVIWGNLTNEFDIQKKTTAVVRSNLMNNLIKTTNANLNNNGNILNADPLFASPGTGNFIILNTSPAVKKGINLSSDTYFSTYLSKDLTNKARLFPSNLGCYENY